MMEARGGVCVAVLTSGGLVLQLVISSNNGSSLEVCESRVLE